MKTQSIFGISRLPVSTIESALTPVQVPKPVVRTLNNVAEDVGDRFVSKEKVAESNAIVKQRNGIGRLMPHFSHPENKVK